MRITKVAPDFYGVTVLADAPIGATVLDVSATVDLNEEDEGGWVVIANGTTPIEYTYVDEDAQTLTLAAPMTVALEEGIGLRVWDVEAGSVVVQYVATVVDDDGDSFYAEVRRELVPTAGADALVGASCSVSDDDPPVIEYVYGREVVLDGGFIAPDTLPDPTIPSEPPTGSPALTAYGHPRGILVTSADVELGTTIDYHLSTVSGFTPGPSTLVESTASTVINIETLPNGAPLEPSTTYYLRTVAHNVAGTAPPGPEIPAGMSLIDSSAVSELIASKIVAGELTGAFILAGAIQVGLITISADGGIVVPGGVTIPANGDAISIIAHAVLKSLTIEGNASLYGLSQLFGKFRVANGITNPDVAPTPGRMWPSLTTAFAGGLAPEFHGMVERIGTSGQWVSALKLFGGNFRVVDKATGTSVFIGTAAMPGTFQPAGGITAIGASYYVLGFDSDRGSDWYVYRFNSSFAKTGEWFFQTNGAIPKTPAIGTDGTQVLIAHSLNDGRLVVREYSTTGTQARANCILPAGSTLYNVGGVHMGNADFGANRLVVATHNGPVTVSDPSTYVDDFTPQTRDTTKEWVRAGYSAVNGLTWDGTRFHHLDDTGHIWDYSRHTANTTVDVAHTWYDGDPGGTGTHETKESDHASYAWPARSWLTTQTPPPPDAGNTDPAQQDKANQVRVYVGVGTVRLQQTLPIGSTMATPLDILNTGSAAPPATNGFISAGSAAGQIESTATDADGPLWWLRGDGQIRLPVNEVTINAVSPFSGSLTLKRMARMVFVTGSLNRASGSSTAFADATAAMPAEFRPLADLILPASVFFNDTKNFQAQILTSGVVQLRMSGDKSFAMGINASWVAQ